ncbi:hypothetical protein [uncultured Desulfuromusa sp.]|uniref:hypothetical protein n=1 Tax=uncultured Desulfuromusa sp. TaxID=219183 RepID=UPI002AA8C5AC|nr:hypothetical protein [uncultured Desulfuromusa sp.]
MNILDLVERSGCVTRKVGSKKGGEYHSPCPTCGGGEKDPHGHSDRMEIFPNQGDYGTWFCRGCAKGGDAIEYLIFHDHMSFPAACELLGKELPEQIEYRTPKPPKQQKQEFTPREINTPEEIWQTKAGELVAHAHSQLRANDEQLAWLASRGISAASAHKHNLGWLPGEKGKPAYYRSRKSWGIQAKDKGSRPDSLWIPRGIVIPQIIDDKVQRLRIRRPEADRELFLPNRSYHVMPGSGQAPFLIYNGQRVVTVIEAELDGIMIDEHAGDLTGILAIGNDSAKPDAKSHAVLSMVDLILVALDFDKLKNGRRAGGQAWIWWNRSYRHAIRWPVPVGKDPGDAFKEGLNIKDWIKAACPAAWTEGINGGSCSGGGRPAAGEEVAAATAATVVQAAVTHENLTAIEKLGTILQSSKFVSIDMSGGGCRIDAHENWKEHFKQEFSAISDLVFHQPDVFSYLVDHPDERIDGRNFWKGIGNE